MAYTRSKPIKSEPDAVLQFITKHGIAESTTYTKPNAYLYNGKEEQPMPGKWLDYGARFYDAQLGRWHSVDPLAERHFGITQYNYCLNNPIKYIDNLGLDTLTRDPKNPNTGIAPELKEVVVRPSFFKRVIRTIGNFLGKSYEGLGEQGLPYGMTWYSKTAQGLPPDKAKVTEDGGELPEFGFDPFNLAAKIVEAIYDYDASSQKKEEPKVATDEEIKNATGDNTNNQGQSLDSVVRCYSTGQDSIFKKVHRNSNIGRELTKREVDSVRKKDGKLPSCTIIFN